MRTSTRIIVLALSSHFFIVLGFALGVHAADWSNWRGPEYNGTGNSDKFPLEWGEDKNVVWKTEIPAWGNGTPVVIGESIFFTSQEDGGRMKIHRINKADGKIVWSRECGEERTPRSGDKPGFRGWQKFHDHHNLASASIVGDKEVVIAHFGNGDTYAFDREGNKLWNNNLQELYGKFTIWWGHGATPLLYENNLIIPVMHDTCEDMEEFKENPCDSYIVAFDKKTGEVNWKVLRNTGSKLESCDAYTTPVLWKHEGRTEMILLGGETLDAYDPAKGERLWWLNKGLECIRIVPSPTPVAEIGTIYLVRGKSSPICAVKPKGLGEQPESAIVWTHRQNTPDVPSLVSDGKLMFSVNDRGIAQCFDAESGEVRWTERLPGGTYYPSPLLSGGKVVFLNCDGLAVVLKAAGEFEKLSENKLDGRFFASPIIDGDDLILRSRTHVYKIGKR